MQQSLKFDKPVINMKIIFLINFKNIFIADSEIKHN
jgi:hypothetical protein